MRTPIWSVAIVLAATTSCSVPRRVAAPLPHRLAAGTGHLAEGGAGAASLPSSVPAPRSQALPTLSAAANDADRAEQQAKRSQSTAPFTNDRGGVDITTVRRAAADFLTHARRVSRVGDRVLVPAGPPNTESLLKRVEAPLPDDDAGQTQLETRLRSEEQALDAEVKQTLEREGFRAVVQATATTLDGLAKRAAEVRGRLSTDTRALEAVFAEGISSLSGLVIYPLDRSSITGANPLLQANRAILNYVDSTLREHPTITIRDIVGGTDNATGAKRYNRRLRAKRVRAFIGELAGKAPHASRLSPGQNPSEDGCSHNACDGHTRFAGCPCRTVYFEATRTPK